MVVHLAGWMCCVSHVRSYLAVSRIYIEYYWRAIIYIELFHDCVIIYRLRMLLGASVRILRGASVRIIVVKVRAKYSVLHYPP